jgi:hypothetical protein
MTNLSDKITLTLNEIMSGTRSSESRLFEAEDKDTIGNMQKENLKSVLDVVSKSAQDMLEKICGTEEISSGDPLLDPSKPSLSLLCITSAMTGLMQSPGGSKSKTEETDEETSESFLLAEQSEDKTEEPGGSEGDKAPDKKPESKKQDKKDVSGSDVLSQHMSQFTAVFKKISSLASEKMNNMCSSDEMASGDALLDPKSSALAITTLFSAILEIEKGSGGESNEEFDLVLSQKTSPSEAVLETLLLALHEGEDESLPWEDGPRALKKEIDRRYKGDRRAIKGFLIRVYKHLKDEYKIKVLKQTLDLYKQEKSPQVDSGKPETDPENREQSEKPSKKSSEDSDAPEKQSFLKRHPYLSGYLGGNALSLPFALASASTGFVLPGPVAAGGIASSVAASAGAAAGTAAAIGTAATVIGVGALVAGTAIGLRGMYKSGKMYGNIDTNAGGKKVGNIRKFARNHPVITGILTSPLTFGGSLVIGGMYALGKRAGKTAEVSKALD